MTFVKRFLRTVPVLWDGLVDAVSGTMDTLAFVFRVTWERGRDALGPYAVPILLCGVLLLILILMVKIPPLAIIVLTVFLLAVLDGF